VEVPFEKGLLGHSDADVLAHAVTDALLGAAGLGDIGHYFPDTDERYRDANSIQLLREVRRLVGDSWTVANVDAVVICERPKIREHRETIRENLADALDVEPARVSVRGTTTERLGFAGRGEGIAAQAVCLLEECERDERGPGALRPEPDRPPPPWWRPHRPLQPPLL
jgi:2-C-methyl-D-erythritol 2,4-cyclodiphosphate synthase